MRTSTPFSPRGLSMTYSDSFTYLYSVQICKGIYWLYPSIYEHILLIFSVATLVVNLIEWTANRYCAYYQKLRHDVFRLSNTFPVENQGFIMKSWEVSSLACLRWDRVGLEKERKGYKMERRESHVVLETSTPSPWRSFLLFSCSAYPWGRDLSRSQREALCGSDRGSLVNVTQILKYNNVNLKQNFDPCSSVKLHVF